MSVLIVARADSIRNSLQALLGSIPGITLAAVADDVVAALQWVRIHKPELVVLDPYLLGDETWSLLCQIRDLSPRSKRIVLADDVQQKEEVERPMAEAVLLKGTSPDELVALVERLLAQSTEVASR